MKYLISLKNYWDFYKLVDISYCGNFYIIRPNDDWRYIKVDLDHVKFNRVEDREKLIKEYNIGSVLE